MNLATSRSKGPLQHNKIRPESRKNTSIRAFTCTASHAAASVHIKHESADIASEGHLNLDKNPHVGEHHTSPFCRAEISARNRHPVTVSFGDMRCGFPYDSAQTSGAQIPRQYNVPIEQQHVCSLEVAPTKVRKTKTCTVVTRKSPNVILQRLVLR